MAQIQSGSDREKPLPEFSPWLFWDSDRAKIDYERDASFVLLKTVDYPIVAAGILEAIRQYIAHMKSVQELLANDRLRQRIEAVKKKEE